MVAEKAAMPSAASMSERIIFSFKFVAGRHFQSIASDFRSAGNCRRINSFHITRANGMSVRVNSRKPDQGRYSPSRAQDCQEMKPVIMAICLLPEGRSRPYLPARFDSLKAVKCGVFLG
jgi:hypothetical protein